MAEIEGGYVLLSRRLIESGIWGKPPIYLKVWMYILTKAQHKPYKNLERGELLVSIPELIEVCSYKVGYRTEKPTKTQIFNVLEWLRNPGEGTNEGVTNGAMIETTKTTRGMVVKVLNYNVYQDPKSYERNAGQDDEETASGTMLERQADTINKNDKNDKNEKKKDIGTAHDAGGVLHEVQGGTARGADELKKDELKKVLTIKESVRQDELFEEWWNFYNKKAGDKKKCRTRYKSILNAKGKNKVTHEEIMEGTRRYQQHLKDLKARGEFAPAVKYPYTFLNGENFKDEYEVAKNTQINKPVAKGKVKFEDLVN